MFALPKSTGTTANIVAGNLPSGSTAIMITVWSVIASSNFEYQNAIDAGSRTLNFNPSIRNHGVMVCAAYGDSGISGFTSSYTGSDTVTENVDTATGGTNSSRYAAYTATLTETATRSLDISGPGGAGNYSAAAVVSLWR